MFTCGHRGTWAAAVTRATCPQQTSVLNLNYICFLASPDHTTNHSSLGTYPLPSSVIFQQIVTLILHVSFSIIHGNYLKKGPPTFLCYLPWLGEHPYVSVTRGTTHTRGQCEKGLKFKGMEAQGGGRSHHLKGMVWRAGGKLHVYLGPRKVHVMYLERPSTTGIGVTGTRRRSVEGRAMMDERSSEVHLLLLSLTVLWNIFVQQREQLKGKINNVETL